MQTNFQFVLAYLKMCKYYQLRALLTLNGKFDHVDTPHLPLYTLKYSCLHANSAKSE